MGLGYSCLTLVGVGSGTLLGPEGSAGIWLGGAARESGPGLVGVWLGLHDVSPFFCCCVCGGGGLVGLLFEICIVDASIFTAGRRESIWL